MGRAGRPASGGDGGCAPRSRGWRGPFEFAKAGFALLAERYPDHVRFADLSGRGEQSMVDLQMFAEGGEGAPALSHAQAQQAIASGTMRADEGSGETPEVPAQTAPEKPEEPPAPQERPAPLPPVPGLQAGENAVRALHARWAAEEAMIRRDVPGFSLRQELANPEMRRLMELPGMRMGTPTVWPITVMRCSRPPGLWSRASWSASASARPARRKTAPAPAAQPSPAPMWPA